MNTTLKERAITLIDGFWSQIEENHPLSYHFICGLNPNKLVLAVKEHLKYEQLECDLTEVEKTEQGYSLILQTYNETIKVNTYSDTCIEVRRGNKEFLVFVR